MWASAKSPQSTLSLAQLPFSNSWSQSDLRGSHPEYPLRDEISNSNAHIWASAMPACSASLYAHFFKLGLVHTYHPLLPDFFHFISSSTTCSHSCCPISSDTASASEYGLRNIYLVFPPCFMARNIFPQWH